MENLETKQDERQNQNETEQKFKDDIARLQPLADNGDAKAAYNLGVTYYNAWLDHGENEEYLKFCRKYMRRASDASYPTADFMLGTIAVNPKVANYADAVHYFRKYLNLYDDTCMDSDRSAAYYALAICEKDGLGTPQDIPLAYKHIKEGIDCEGADEVLAEIEENYPMTPDGEIDLSVHGRTIGATGGLIACIALSIFGLALPFIDKEIAADLETPFYIGMAVNMVVYLGLLFWQKWSGWAMLAQWGVLALLSIYLFAGNSTDGINMRGPLFQFFVVWALNGIFQLLLFRKLQKRKKGCALPWCSVTGMRDDGRSIWRRVKDSIMAYGEGEAYRAHSASSKAFTVYCYIATGIIAALGIYVSYLYVTSGREWGLDVEWKCWKSPKLWGFLCFIGFFLQFLDWRHFSYKTYDVYEDGYGREVKRERNRDVLTEMEGGFLMPLLMHFIFVPAIYGAVLYYIIMVAVALLGTSVPYLVVLLLLVVVRWFYIVARRLLPRRYRIVFLAIWFAFLAYVLLAVAAGSGQG